MSESVAENVDEIKLPPSAIDVEEQRNETTVISEEIPAADEKSGTTTAEISEQEDITQAEIELTVDENAIEEPNLVAAVTER